MRRMKFKAAPNLGGAAKIKKQSNIISIPIEHVQEKVLQSSNILSKLDSKESIEPDLLVNNGVDVLKNPSFENLPPFEHIQEEVLQSSNILSKLESKESIEPDLLVNNGVDLLKNPSLENLPPFEFKESTDFKDVIAVLDDNTIKSSEVSSNIESLDVPFNNIDIISRTPLNCKCASHETDPLSITNQICSCLCEDNSEVIDLTENTSLECADNEGSVIDKNIESSDKYTENILVTTSFVNVEESETNSDQESVPNDAILIDLSKASKKRKEKLPRSKRIASTTTEISGDKIPDDIFLLPTKVKKTVDVSKEKKIYIERKKNYKNKLVQGKLEKRNMTMFDLIFYNPDDNHMPGRKEKVPRSRTSSTSNSLAGTNGERAEEEAVEEEGLNIGKGKANNVQSTMDLKGKIKNVKSEVHSDSAIVGETASINQTDEDCNGASEDSLSVDSCPDSPEPAVLAPQLKIGPNGELIVDEKSLSIKTTAAKNCEDVLRTTEIIEEDNETCHYGKYSKRRKRATEWTRKETSRFYRALSTVGTDFSLMETVFAWRSRAELKTKFKKEERINRTLIDIALNDCTQFDFSIFDESDYDPEEDRKECKRHEKQLEKKKKHDERHQKFLIREEEKKQKKEQKAIEKQRKKIIKDAYKETKRVTRKRVVRPKTVGLPAVEVVDEISNLSTATSVMVEAEEFVCELILANKADENPRISPNQTIEENITTVEGEFDGDVIFPGDQVHFPLSAIRTEDETQFLDVRGMNGFQRVPIPTLTPETEGIILISTTSEDELKEQIFHVYLAAPLPTERMNDDSNELDESKKGLLTL